MVRAQLKIQQMAFVLIAVTLFFAMAGLFILAIQFSGLREGAEDLEKENAQKLAIKIANSPEFSCGQSYGTGKLNCIDADKAMVLKDNAAKYSDFWRVSNIEIWKVYPSSRDDWCDKSNYPNCNSIGILVDEHKGGYSSFVTLCRKELNAGDTYDHCDLARVIVSPEEIPE